MSDTTQNNLDPSAVILEWSYSGKALRAQALLFLLLSLIVVGGGLYATFAEKLGDHYLAAWGAITGILVLLWGYHYAIYFYRVWTIRYRLSDRYLYSYRGLLTRISDSTELVYIDDIRLVQTLFDRLFNGGVGSIILYCASDRTDSTQVLSGIDKPRDVFEKINSLRTGIRAKRSILTGGA